MEISEIKQNDLELKCVGIITQCLADLGSGWGGMCGGVMPCNGVLSAWECGHCPGCCWAPDGLGCPHQPMNPVADSETLQTSVSCNCMAMGGDMAGGFQQAYCGVYDQTYQCCQDLAASQCGSFPACYSNNGDSCPDGINDACNSHTFNCWEPG